MRIAQLAPVWESVPPKKYGGSERVVHWLTEELVRRGHHVTLYASGDSETSAELRAICDQAVRLHDSMEDGEALHMVMMDRVRREASQFDVIHSHLESRGYPVLRTLQTPSLSTIHSRLDLPEASAVYDEFREVPLVSISNAQRTPVPQARWVKTVYHGMPNELFRFGSGDAGHLAFVGRICSEKRPDRAIEIAKRTGLRLLIAAKLEAAQEEYFDIHVRPHLSEQIQYLGEVDHREKEELLRSARALLFPIDWPEPFGLVMTEAFACGTPVVAWRCGSVPEVVKDGVDGFIVDSIEEAVSAVQHTANLDRKSCRTSFEERFSAEVMTDGYLEAYEQLEFAANGIRRREPLLAERAALEELEDAACMPLLTEVSSARGAVLEISARASSTGKSDTSL
ncbi:MAG: glycosyltransferase family 4 protein [Bdellovibrionales bacterium]|nr:glycosyltransferase family 4 protein [Bdellovibrionales bacterium]